MTPFLNKIELMIQKHVPIRDTENTNVQCYALRFRSDLSYLIEQNRRRSRATSRIMRLKEWQRWPEDERQNGTLAFPVSLTPGLRICFWQNLEKKL